ncbi:MAG: PIN domain-containing protein [Verrucomicrobia bacterium]|nr:PIN domain-containing protein [Verrucomicrobiota bacterium]
MRHLLIDTHIFLWSQFNLEKLPAKIVSLLKDSSICWHLSQVSVWEIQVKYDLKKLPLPAPPQTFMDQLVKESGIHFQEIQNKAIFMLGKLPQIHRDPFDRLLVATALVNGWEIATVDTILSEYPIQTTLDQ